LIERSEIEQIIVSGVGGQGILFITRLMAEAAIHKGHPVLTSETHGMAQRGGIVVSHLKAGSFSSPLIRPARADVLVLLKKENLENHLFYLKSGGIVIINSPTAPEGSGNMKMLPMDADGTASRLHQPGSANLVLTGFAFSVLKRMGKQIFCDSDDIRAILHKKFAGRDKILKASLSAFDSGVLFAEKVNV
jgi:indolepyruvate ferredoxin oxidoreductase beta subunit